MTESCKTIAVLPGDGIGPEVTRAAVQLLTDCATAFGHQFEFRELPFGGDAIDRCGAPLPPETLAGCRSADAILLGAIGGPKWDSLDRSASARKPACSALRKELDLYINLRPIRLRPALRGISPLRPERLADCDFEIVRELAGDIYFGEHELEGEKSEARARDVAELHRRGSRARRALRLRTRHGPQPPSDQRGQSQRSGHVHALAPDGHGSFARISRHHARPSLRRQRRDADHAAPRAIRRDPHVESFRRHSERRSGGAGGFDRLDSVDEPRPHGAARALRADPRLSSHTCRKRRGLPAGRDSFREPDAAGIVRPGDRSPMDRGSGRSRARSRLSHGRHRRAGRTIVGASELTEQIRSELHDVLVHHERYGWGV